MHLLQVGNKYVNLDRVEFIQYHERPTGKLRQVVDGVREYPCLRFYFPEPFANATNFIDFHGAEAVAVREQLDAMTQRRVSVERSQDEGEGQAA